MIARKCDRCGAYYDEPKQGEVSGIWWKYGVDSVGSLRDLCPDCTDKLGDWLEGVRSELDEESEGNP